MQGPAPSTLRVRVLCAHNLPNKDTGMFGDVSDPYVVVRVGAEHFRTPSIDNDLNPVWDKGNEFSFTVDPSPQLHLQLDVMNANVFRDDLLGRTSLALGSLAPGQPGRRRVRLDGCPKGELEFEVLLGALVHFTSS
jgi:Ca2+-dependent lipid-binding protein